MKLRYRITHFHLPQIRVGSALPLIKYLDKPIFNVHNLIPKLVLHCSIKFCKSSIPRLIYGY